MDRDDWFWFAGFSLWFAVMLFWATSAHAGTVRKCADGSWSDRCVVVAPPAALGSSPSPGGSRVVAVLPDAPGTRTVSVGASSGVVSVSSSRRHGPYRSKPKTLERERALAAARSRGR